MIFQKNTAYKNFILFLFICLIFFTPQNIIAGDLVFPDFDQSLMRNGKSRFTYDLLYLRNTKDPHLIEMRKAKYEFKKIYEKNRVHFKNDLSAPNRIPKIVHQIWLGSEVPEKFKIWMSSWLNMAGWEYKLWTDKDVKTLVLRNQNLYDNAKNYGEKSDILRYEILFNEGGLYVDVDFDNINTDLFTKLNNSFDFYVGFEPIEHKQPSISSPLIGNAIIGSIPGHPLLQNIILDMESHYKKHADKWAVVTTGPIYFTEKIIQFNRAKGSKLINIYLPPTFLFPLTYTEVRSRLKENLKNLVKSETAAVHYWSGSWLDDEEE